MVESLKYIKIIDCSFKQFDGSFVSSFCILSGVYHSWNKTIKSTPLVSKFAPNTPKFAPNTQPTRTLIVHSTTKPKHQTAPWRDENSPIFVNPIN